MRDTTPELRIRFTKRPDGAVVLQCVRRDGSATWERHDKQAVFFSFHDLSHFAVETVLGFGRGFYGLIADGWDIADTTGRENAANCLQKAYLWSMSSGYSIGNALAVRFLCRRLNSIHRSHTWSRMITWMHAARSVTRNWWRCGGKSRSCKANGQPFRLARRLS